MSLITFALPPVLILGLVVTTGLPLIVGFVTKTITHPGIKAILLAALASATGFGTELLNAIKAGTTYDAGTGIVLALTSFLIAVGLHYGFWKPTGLTNAVQQLGPTAGRHEK